MNLHFCYKSSHFCYFASTEVYTYTYYHTGQRRARGTIDIDLTNNSILNCPITPEEIEQAVYILKSKKSPGNNQVRNEYICSTLSIFLFFLCRPNLFF